MDYKFRNVWMCGSWEMIMDRHAITIVQSPIEESNQSTLTEKENAPQLAVPT